MAIPSMKEYRQVPRPGLPDLQSLHDVTLHSLGLVHRVSLADSGGCGKRQCDESYLAELLTNVTWQNL